MAKRGVVRERFYDEATFDAVVSKLTARLAVSCSNALTMSVCSFGAMMDIDRAI